MKKIFLSSFSHEVLLLKYDVVSELLNTIHIPFGDELFDETN